MANYVILLFFVVLLLLISKQKNNDHTVAKKTKSFGIISTTLKGHMVRSKGEKRIADWLYSHKIKYKYEPKLSKFVPDFFLPEHGVLIEYYGLANASGIIGINYRKKIDHKRKYFNSLSVILLELYQDDLSHLDHIIPDLLQTIN
ncbi:MAG: hypothetical protein GPJ54_06275 [Candidatus Heimdallarchaeota archaeon]|nr:hypothetical protein [Candidatus Heimdallarchaeota archaeon]